MFLTKVGIVKKRSLEDRVWLMFEPFNVEVWLVLGGSCVLAVIVFILAADVDYTNDMLREDMAYNTIMTGASQLVVCLRWCFFFPSSHGRDCQLAQHIRVENIYLFGVYRMWSPSTRHDNENQCQRAFYFVDHLLCLRTSWRGVSSLTTLTSDHIFADA